MSWLRELVVSLEEDEKLTDPIPLEANPDYVPQPEVAIYLPEEDGVPASIRDLQIEGSSVKSIPWRHQVGFETSQQMLAREEMLKEEEEMRVAARQARRHRYSLYVVTPQTDPYLYESLVDEQGGPLGAMLTHPLAEYPDEMLGAVTDAVGLEHLHLDLESVRRAVALL